MMKNSYLVPGDSPASLVAGNNPSPAVSLVLSIRPLLLERRLFIIKEERKLIVRWSRFPGGGGSGAAVLVDNARARLGPIPDGLGHERAPDGPDFERAVHSRGIPHLHCGGGERTRD